MELLKLKEGLWMVKQWQWENMIIELDSKAIVQKLQGKNDNEEADKILL